MDIKDMDKLVELARIEMSQEEKQELILEMDSILGYVKQIQEAAVGDIENSQPVVRNIFRDDENPHLSEEFTKDILDNAPKTEGGYLKVKKIL